MDKKIIFFDIDGTILSHKTGGISDRVKKAIQATSALGHLCFIASGRPIGFLADNVKNIGFDGFVLANGADIKFHNHELEARFMDYEYVKDLCHNLKAKNIEYILQTPTYCYLPKDSHCLYDFYSHCHVNFDMFCNDYDEDEQMHRVVKMEVWTNSTEEVEYCKQAFKNFNYETNTMEEVYSIEDDELRNMNINDINDEISFMILRNIGSVELNFKEIKKFLEYLIENYKGKVLNNPQAMLKGMTKHYLTQLDPKILKTFGINLIPTKIFGKEITFEEICKEYPEHREKYLIKPVTGELSNSLKCLAEIDEQFLRYKETKVGGWVIQPIQKEIWKGEFQLSFLGGKLIYSQMKEYTKTNNNIPVQKSRIIKKYKPTEKETKSLQKLIEYVSNLYDLQIDICRTDFMKEADGTIKLLEFEMVNPGYFIGYMDINDPDIIKINESIYNYCEKKLKE